MTATSHSFNVSLAAELGLQESIILQHFYFWHQLNSDNKDMLKEGRVWCFSSRKTIREVFPYMSDRQIRTCIAHLIESDFLLKGDFNENKLHKTSWYALTGKAIKLFKIDQCIGQNDQPLVEMTNHWSNRPIDNNNIDNNNIDNNKMALPFSSDLFRETWDTLIRQPKWKKKSKDALKMCAEQLSGYTEEDAIEMMRNSIRGGWQGLFELEKKASNGKSDTAYRLHIGAREYGEDTL